MKSSMLLISLCAIMFWSSHCVYFSEDETIIVDPYLQTDPLTGQVVMVSPFVQPTGKVPIGLCYFDQAHAFDYLQLRNISDVLNTIIE